MTALSAIHHSIRMRFRLFSLAPMISMLSFLCIAQALPFKFVVQMFKKLRIQRNKALNIRRFGQCSFLRLYQQLGIQYYTLSDWRSKRSAAIKAKKYQMTDDEAKQRITELERENAELRKANDIVPSLLVEFRKRLSEDVLNEINEMIVIHSNSNTLTYNHKIKHFQRYTAFSYPFKGLSRNLVETTIRFLLDS